MTKYLIKVIGPRILIFSNNNLIEQDNNCLKITEQILYVFQFPELNNEKLYTQ